ncbi:MAG: hypothetical protein N2C14_02170 [Planctomycetales bacterium]
MLDGETWRSETVVELDHSEQLAWRHGADDEERILGTPCIVLGEPTDAVEVKRDFHDPDAGIVLDMFAERKAAARDAGQHGGVLVFRRKTRFIIYSHPTLFGC